MPRPHTRRPEGVVQEDPIAVDRRLRRSRPRQPTTTATAPDAHAATRKVVIVVGPVGSCDRRPTRTAPASSPTWLAATAQVVKEIYSPYATWSRVRTPRSGANLLIYLGHGNGWPSPYAPYSTTSKNGMGLNSSAGNGNSNMKYYGEYYMKQAGPRPQRRRCLLNRLCYASGNNEWGSGNPTKSTAIKRVDNYGYGFLKRGRQGGLRQRHLERRLRRQGPVHGLAVDDDGEPVLDRPEQDVRLPVHASTRRRSTGRRRAWTRTRRAGTTARSSAS